MMFSTRHCTPMLIADLSKIEDGDHYQRIGSL